MAGWDEQEVIPANGCTLIFLFPSYHATLGLKMMMEGLPHCEYQLSSYTTCCRRCSGVLGPLVAMNKRASVLGQWLSARGTCTPIWLFVYLTPGYIESASEVSAN